MTANTPKIDTHTNMQIGSTMSSRSQLKERKLSFFLPLKSADKFLLSDAIALNIGGDDWQRNQVDLAYQAAQNSGTGLKLFYSFDLTEMPCNLDDLVARVNKYVNHPNQFKVNGKPMISSYSGDCLGNSGWANLKARTNGYLMPFIWGLEGQFNQWPSLDSWYW